MTVIELVSQLQMLGISPNAKIVVWDDKEREYDLVKVDSMFKGEVVFDIKRLNSSFSKILLISNTKERILLYTFKNSLPSSGNDFSISLKKLDLPS